MGQPGVAVHGREGACASPFVRDRIRRADAQGKVGVVVEEERGHVIVKDQKQHIGLFIRQPLLHRTVCVKNGGPDRIVVFSPIQRKADGRGMGSRDCANDFRHT